MCGLLSVFLSVAECVLVYRTEEIDVTSLLTYSFFCNPLNTLSSVDLFSCAHPHTFMYIDFITSSLFREISRATTCDVKCLVTLLAGEKLKCLVTLLAGEKLTGAKCTIVSKEHQAPRPFRGAFQAASCSMLCSSGILINVQLAFCDCEIVFC